MCLILTCPTFFAQPGVPSQQRSYPRKHSCPQRADHEGVHGQALGPAWGLHEEEPRGHSERWPQHEEMAGPRVVSQETCQSEQRHVSFRFAFPAVCIHEGKCCSSVKNKLFIKCWSWLLQALNAYCAGILLREFTEWKTLTIYCLCVPL